MHLIIGGAYQGKLDYAREKFGLSDSEIFTCRDDGVIDFSARCISSIEEYALWCVRNRLEPLEQVKQQEERLRSSILICTDIFCGVVPVDPEMRAWREAVGRMLNDLSQRAESVTRLFCSLPQVLK